MIDRLSRQDQARLASDYQPGHAQRPFCVPSASALSILCCSPILSRRFFARSISSVSTTFQCSSRQE